MWRWRLKHAYSLKILEFISPFFAHEFIKCGLYVARNKIILSFLNSHLNARSEHVASIPTRIPRVVCKQSAHCSVLHRRGTSPEKKVMSLRVSVKLSSLFSRRERDLLHPVARCAARNLTRSLSLSPLHLLYERASERARVKMLQRDNVGF